MPYTHAHLIAAALGLAIYVVFTRMGKQRRLPSAALGWVVAIVTLPYLAIPLYLLIGDRKLARGGRAPVSDAGPPASVDALPTWVAGLTRGLSLPPPRHAAGIRILADGPAALEALLQVIDGATQQLDLCTFVYADDAVGRRVADALAAAAARGCHVRVLVDAVGGLRMSGALRRRLAEAGVEVRRFSPLLHDPRRTRGNLRNHRKLAVADRRWLWTGGRNIADEYFFDGSAGPAWLDMSVVLEAGPAVDAANLFAADWALAGGGTTVGPAGTVGTAEHALAGPLAQLVPSGPDQRADTAHALLLNAVFQAQARILVATPYFVPDDALLQALIIACRRGVAVTLLLPARSNHRLADLARGRNLRELADAGARILLRPDMLHAKLVVVDDALALCGSANLDARSLFLNFEMYIAFHGRAQVEAFAQWHARAGEPARAFVAQRPSLPRDIVEGLVRAIGFQL